MHLLPWMPTKIIFTIFFCADRRKSCWEILKTDILMPSQVLSLLVKTKYKFPLVNANYESLTHIYIEFYFKEI